MCLCVCVFVCIYGLLLNFFFVCKNSIISLLVKIFVVCLCVCVFVCIYGLLLNFFFVFLIL